MTIKTPATIKRLISAVAFAALLGVSPSFADDTESPAPADGAEEMEDQIEKARERVYLLRIDVQDWATGNGETGHRRAHAGRMEYAEFQASFSAVKKNKELFEPARPILSHSADGTPPTGTRPEAPAGRDLARWTGKMVAFKLDGAPLEGETEVFFDIASGKLGILLRNIKLRKIESEDRDYTYNRDTISFPDVKVADNGSFVQMLNGAHHIRGQFYGPKPKANKPESGHAEVAFTFRRYGIRGAGGAIRVKHADDSGETQPKLQEWREYQRALARVIAVIEALREKGDKTLTGLFLIPSDAEGVIPSSALEGSEYSQRAGKCGLFRKGRAVRCVAGNDKSGVRMAVDMQRGDMENIHENEDVQVVKVQSMISLPRVIHSYGAWMEHAGFYLYTGLTANPAGGEVYSSKATKATYTLPFYGGSQSTGGPSETATYLGAMVGTLTKGADQEDILVGNAEVVFTAASDGFEYGSLKVRLDGFKNLDGGSVPEAISFKDLSVDGDGKIEPYEKMDDKNLKVEERLTGGFYGPEHQEIAGEFLHSNVFGVFGAVALAPEPDTGSEPSPDENAPGGE